MTAETPSESVACGRCPAQVWCLVSGGKDSMTLLDKTYEAGRLAGVISLDTGTAMPGWKEDLQAAVAEYSVPHEFYRTPESYLALVTEYGFPKTPDGHIWAFGALKDRPLRLAGAAHRGAVFATGVRKDESERRFKFTKPCTDYGRYDLHLHAEIIGMKNEEVHAYVRSRALKVSRWRTLKLPADCRCGAFAHEGEYRDIKQLAPSAYDEIRGWERSVAKNGIGKARTYPFNRWGDVGRGAIPKPLPYEHLKVGPGQTFLNRFADVDPAVVEAICGPDGCGGQA